MDNWDILEWSSQVRWFLVGVVLWSKYHCSSILFVLQRIDRDSTDDEDSLDDSFVDDNTSSSDEDKVVIKGSGSDSAKSSASEEPQPTIFSSRTRSSRRRTYVQAYILTNRSFSNEDMAL